MLNERSYTLENSMIPTWTVYDLKVVLTIIETIVGDKTRLLKREETK
jgi:hypothetical protein